jgi:hypothetical protein
MGVFSWFLIDWRWLFWPSVSKNLKKKLKKKLGGIVGVFWIVQNIKAFGSCKGRFTLWTMKSSHVRGLFCVGRLHGTTSMVRITKILVFMVHGPFTRCKPNVDHEE